MTDLRNVNMRAVQYLEEIEVERWARCRFTTKRYNLMTTNIAKYMNVIFRDAREMPVVPLLENIQTKLHTWFHDRRAEAGSLTGHLTRWSKQQLDKRSPIAQRMMVQPINPNEYRVTGAPSEGMVNFTTKSCTCRKFDLDQYPCIHAMAACRYRHLPYHVMCSSYYYAETLRVAYADSIYPVGDIDQWEVPQEVQTRVVRPPDMRRRSAGRPRKKRIPSQGEDRIQYKCCRCRGRGHSRAK